MTSPFAEYFAQLEAAAATVRMADLYLWPRTPEGGDLQHEILERMGVSDRDATSRCSRPAQILRCLEHLLRHNLLAPDFSVCDVACGDAVVLSRIQKAFPQAHCAGIDCRGGQLATHRAATEAGVQLVTAYIQHLFAADPPIPFDVALMLNTYRDWPAAELRVHEVGVPHLADAWFARNARYAIVTATAAQIRQLTLAGWRLARLGPGEDRSTMVCVTRAALPRSAAQRLRAMVDWLGGSAGYGRAVGRAYRRGGLQEVLEAGVAWLKRRSVPSR